MSQYVTTPDGQRHAFPDEATPEQIKRALSNYMPDSSSGGAAYPSMTAKYNPFQAFMRTNVTEGLPSAGGFVGSILGTPFGPPGRMAGAGIGGAAGEVGREALNLDPLSPSKIGIQGGIQAGLQGIGEGVVAGAAKVAGPLYRKALGVLPSLAERFGTTTEELAAMVFGKRLRISQAGTKEAQGLADRMRLARSETLGRVRRTVPAGHIAEVAIKDAERSIGRRLTDPERHELVDKIQDEANAILSARTHGVVPSSGSRFTMRELEQVKEVAAKNSRAAYRASQQGMSVAADPELQRQLASGARNVLGKVPGVAAQNAELRNLMAAKEAIRKAINRTSGEWSPLHVGPISTGVKIPRDKVGDLALALTSKNFQRIARQSPRAAAEALHQLMISAEADATNQ